MASEKKNCIPNNLLFGFGKIKKVGPYPGSNVFVLDEHEFIFYSNLWFIQFALASNKNIILSPIACTAQTVFSALHAQKSSCCFCGIAYRDGLDGDFFSFFFLQSIGWGLMWIRHCRATYVLVALWHCVGLVPSSSALESAFAPNQQSNRTSFAQRRPRARCVVVCAQICALTPLGWQVGKNWQVLCQTVGATIFLFCQKK